MCLSNVNCINETENGIIWVLIDSLWYYGEWKNFTISKKKNLIVFIIMTTLSLICCLSSVLISSNTAIRLTFLKNSSEFLMPGQKANTNSIFHNLPNSNAHGPYFLAWHAGAIKGWTQSTLNKERWGDRSGLRKMVLEREKEIGGLFQKQLPLLVIPFSVF